jgi:hypothetical protein
MNCLGTIISSVNDEVEGTGEGYDVFPRFLLDAVQRDWRISRLEHLRQHHKTLVPVDNLKRKPSKAY